MLKYFSQYLILKLVFPRKPQDCTFLKRLRYKYEYILVYYFNLSEEVIHQKGGIVEKFEEHLHRPNLNPAYLNCNTF